MRFERAVKNGKKKKKKELKKIDTEENKEKLTSNEFE